MKYFIATVVALTLATAGGLTSANESTTPTEPKLSVGPGAVLFGQLEGSYSYDYDGDYNFDTLGGTYVGVNVERELLGKPIFGTLSGELDEDADLTTRDAFLGVGVGPVEFSFGRMPSIQRNVADATVNIFEGRYFTGDESSGRIGSQAKTKINMYGVSLVGVAAIDDSNFDSLESWGAGASYRLGPVGLVGAFAKDDVNDVTTLIGGSTYDIGDVTVGASFAQDETSTGTTNTLSYVASYSLGLYSFRGGYQNIEDATDTFIGEVAYNLNENAAAYINGRHDDDDAITVGFRYSF